MDKGRGEWDGKRDIREQWLLRIRTCQLGPEEVQVSARHRGKSLMIARHSLGDCSEMRNVGDMKLDVSMYL
jgi:hypothetical protein